MPRSIFLLAVILAVVAPPTAFCQRHGVIDDPDGFTNLRAEPDSKSAIVAVVKRGEVFELDVASSGWFKVSLTSGKKGYMHSSRIRIHAITADLADTNPADEVMIAARQEGFDYYSVARAAAKGEAPALQRYFAFVGDGAGAEIHSEVLGTVIHLLGDDKLAAFLKRQSRVYRTNVLALLTEGETLYPFEPKQYLKRCFPKTAALLVVN